MLAAVVAQVLSDVNSRVHSACVSRGVIQSRKKRIDNKLYTAKKINYKKGNQTVLSHCSFTLNIIAICLQ